MITFNNLKAFVKEAMNKNCEIWFSMYNYMGIVIEYAGAQIKFSYYDSFTTITIGFKGTTYRVPVTQKEILEWKLILEDVKVYSEQFLENNFFNFFKSDNKPVDINDLDDAEEE